MINHVCSTCGKAKPCVFVSVNEILRYPVCDECRKEPAYGWINHPLWNEKAEPPSDLQQDR